MAPLHVRSLRPGEDAAWFAVRVPRNGVVTAFTSAPGFRSDAHLLAERDGAPVGRMESLLLEPHEATLVHPLVADSADFEVVTDALVKEGLRVAAALDVAEIELLIMESMPRSDELRARAAGWGFVPHQSKAFYRAPVADVRWELAALPSGLAFRSATSEDDPRLVAALGRVLRGSWEDDRDPAAHLKSYVTRCRADGCLHVDDWETLEDPSGPLGVVIPALADASHEVGTNFYVGLVPEARGRGLGAAIHLRGLATLRDRGAKRFIGSTDLRNTPMRRVFENVGYAQGTQQHILRLARRERPVAAP